MVLVSPNRAFDFDETFQLRKRFRTNERMRTRLNWYWRADDLPRVCHANREQVPSFQLSGTQREGEAVAAVAVTGMQQIGAKDVRPQQSYRPPVERTLDDEPGARSSGVGHESFEGSRIEPLEL